MSEKIPTNKKEVEVIPEIAELEQPLKNIIEQIRPSIERGDYGIIVGDDASGRIPALILGNFIRNISENKNLNKPQIIFIPGKLSHPQNPAELRGLLEKNGFHAGKKILIVTEAVETGRSLEGLVKAIKQLGIDFVITTIGLEAPDDEHLNRTRRDNLGDTKIISGNYWHVDKQTFAPQIYEEPKFSGVFKRSGDNRSHSARDLLGTWTNNFVPVTRKDGKILGNKLVEWYLKSNEE